MNIPMYNKITPVLQLFWYSQQKKLNAKKVNDQKITELLNRNNFGNHLNDEMKKRIETVIGEYHIFGNHIADFLVQTPGKPSIRTEYDVIMYNDKGKLTSPHVGSGWYINTVI